MATMIAAPANADPALGGPPAAAGSIGLRLLDAPVSAGNDPRARVYIVDHLAPGTSITRHLEVSNTTASIAHVSLYAAAATIANGAFLGAAGHTANDLSNWTSVVPASPDVPAGAKLTATVTISVPTDAAPGEQYAVIWAEARSSAAPAGGVIQVTRVGIRLYLSIGPGGAPAASMTIDSLTAKRSPDGRPMVVAVVHNTGGRALDISGTLQLSAGPGGLSAGPFPATLGVTLAIGDTEPVAVTLNKLLPAGPWSAMITLKSGLLERSAAAIITFPDSGAAGPVKPLALTVPSKPGWPYPAIAGLLALLLLAIAASIVAMRLRPRLRSPNANAGTALPPS